MGEIHEETHAFEGFDCGGELKAARFRYRKVTSDQLYQRCDCRVDEHTYPDWA